MIMHSCDYVAAKTTYWNVNKCNGIYYQNEGKIFVAINYLISIIFDHIQYQMSKHACI